MTGARNALPPITPAHCREIINARESHPIHPGIGWFWEGNQRVKVTLNSLTESDCCHSEDTAGLEDASSSVSKELTKWPEELSGAK